MGVGIHSSYFLCNIVHLSITKAQPFIVDRCPSSRPETLEAPKTDSTDVESFQLAQPEILCPPRRTLQIQTPRRAHPSGTTYWRCRPTYDGSSWRLETAYACFRGFPYQEILHSGVFTPVYIWVGAPPLVKTQTYGVPVRACQRL